MAKIRDKRKMAVLINKTTYNKLFDFVQNNELPTSRLAPGNVVEMSLNLFFKEVSKRPLEDIAVEFLNDGKAGASSND